MELQPEHISQLISKHLTGKLSKDEKALLKSWLADPYNELQFNKIIDANSFLDKVEKYKKYDSTKAFKKVFNTKRKPVKVWIAYAAAIVLPIVAAVGLLFNTWNKSYNGNILVSNDISTEEVVLSTASGAYIIGKKDTTFNIADIQIQSNEEQLSYQVGSATAKQVELEYNSLQTPKGLKYKLILSDGTAVWLNSETKFKYPVNFITETREVFVEEGEAFFEVAKNKEKPFIVNFNEKKIRVLGTEFNVKAYKSEDFDLVTLVEGSIRLISEHNNVELIPNQQAIIAHSNNNMQIKTVEGNLFTAWKDNIYLYKNQPLNTIVRDLERDFDIKVFYQNQDLKHKKFSLKISRKLSYESIFSAIEKTHEVDIEINNNNIIIRKK